MNTQVVQLRPAARQARALEVPAVIAPSVNLMRFSEALAMAGLVGRHDSNRGVLVIQAPEADPAESIAADAEAGMRWYNAIGRLERARWHAVAGSAVPADAWRAYVGQRCPECGGTGFDEDATCDFCDGTGREGGARD